jgi:hypothetical protein
MKKLTGLALGLLLASMLASCGMPTPALSTSATKAPRPALEDSAASPGPSGMPQTEWHLVVIGDSSLGKLGRAFASQIQKDVGVQVVLYSNVVPELSAGRILGALEMDDPPLQSWEEELAEALRQAEVVVIFLNPLESIDPDHPLDHAGCFEYRAPESCSPESYEAYTAHMKAIWARILELRAGQPTILRALDTFVPLVAPWKESGVFEACTACFENESEAARQAAEAYGIPFLSRYDAFNGADHSEDPREKGYIVSDGVHPSDLAAQYTAQLLSEMGYEPVSPP